MSKDKKKCKRHKRKYPCFFCEFLDRIRNKGED